jgi:hypothetical protein
MADTLIDDFRIVSPELTVEALRDSGYKSTVLAMAELIDNSAEARAKLIQIFCIEMPGMVTERTRHAIQRIAVLDDGEGMDEPTLRRSLKFGDGSRQQRKGIGRFGMGLPNSSMSQCTRVDVWTWQNGPDNALTTHLDLSEVQAGMTDVPEPVPEALPQEWRDLSATEIGTTGTLVVWSSLDRVQWRGATATLRNTELLIGRIYRRFIASGQTEILLVPVRDGEACGEPFYARPNDPGFLTPDSATPAPFDKEPMFRPFGPGSVGEIGVQPFPINVNSTEHIVTIRTSVSKIEARRPDMDNSPWPEEHKAKVPGITPWGKRAGQNIGISLVRSDRELTLDPAWADPSRPVERWWGIEIEFPPVLDEVFGVTNNKQHAMTFSGMASFDWTLEALPGEEFSEFMDRLEEEGDTRLPLISLVHHIRTKLIPALRHELEDQTQGTGTSRQRYDTATAQAAKTIKRRAEEGHTGVTDELGEEADEEESRREQIENLTKTHNFDPEDAKRQVDETLSRGWGCRMLTSRQPNSPAFFDVELLPDVIQTTLNTTHPAYEHLIKVLDDDVEGLTKDQLAERLRAAAVAFRILLFSWARYEDEQPEPSRTRVKKMRWAWGNMALEFFANDAEEDA